MITAQAQPAAAGDPAAAAPAIHVTSLRKRYGDVTALAVHVEHADTHMTLNPVAVNYQCWAARRASVHVSADGAVDFDREF